MDIQLSFSKSKSAMYGKVLHECQKFVEFTQEDTFHVLRLTFIEAIQKWDSFNFVLLTAYTWSSFRFFIKDKPIASRADIKRLFYSLQELKYCMNGHQNEQDKLAYCGQTFWGCHKLKSVEVLPNWYTIDKGWYTIGSLEKGSWKIDKDRILNRLLNEAKEKLVDNCPNFDKDRIEQVVKALPDELDIATKNWKLITSTKFIDGQFKQVCTGLEWIGNFSDYKPEQFLQK